MAVSYRVRPARVGDARALCEIERRCFSDPWSPQGFREMLAAEHGFGLVADVGARSVGYLIGREIMGEGEILNLAVAPECRRLGIAAGLLQSGLSWLRSRGATEVFLEVRQSNRAAIALYLSRGFRPVAQRPSYYRNPVEDALVLRLDLKVPA